MVCQPVLHYLREVLVISSIHVIKIQLNRYIARPWLEFCGHDLPLQNGFHDFGGQDPPLQDDFQNQQNLQLMD